MRSYSTFGDSATWLSGYGRCIAKPEKFTAFDLWELSVEPPSNIRCGK
jgi:hypothetical protein